MSVEESSNASVQPLHKHPSNASRPSSTTPSNIAYNKPWIAQGKAKTGGQIFLCVIGGTISMSIGMWLAIFSHDLQWRRFVFAFGALVCALLFALLGFNTVRHVTHARHPPPHAPRLRRQTTTSSTRISNGCQRLSRQTKSYDIPFAGEHIDDQHHDHPFDEDVHVHHKDHHKDHHTLHAHFDKSPDRPIVENC